MAQQTSRIREPSMNKSEVVQIGPLMTQFGIYNVKVLPAKLADDVSYELDEDPNRGADSIILNYTADDLNCIATIALDDGKLRCHYCGPVDKKVTWCKHIHNLIVSRFDHKLFTGPGKHIIPLTPSEGIYVPVHLEDAVIGTTNSKNFYRAIVKVSERDEKGQPGGEFHDFTIGYTPKAAVCTAELRSMLSTWLAGHMNDTRFYAPVKCQGTDHVNNTKHSVFTNMFYEAMFGLCLDCVLKMYDRAAAEKAKKKTYQADAPDF